MFPRSFPRGPVPVLAFASPRLASLVLFSTDASPSVSPLLAPPAASSPPIQTPGPGTVEIIKRRPAFGRTSGIRVGALCSRHYPPRKLGRDETAFLSLSLSLSLPLCLSSLLSFFLHRDSPSVRVSLPLPSWFVFSSRCVPSLFSLQASQFSRSPRSSRK